MYANNEQTVNNQALLCFNDYLRYTDFRWNTTRSFRGSWKNFFKDSIKPSYFENLTA